MRPRFTDNSGHYLNVKDGDDYVADTRESFDGHATRSCDVIQCEEWFTREELYLNTQMVVVRARWKLHIFKMAMF